MFSCAYSLQFEQESQKQCEQKKWRGKVSLDIFKSPNYLGKVSNQLFQLNLFTHIEANLLQI